MADLKTKDSFFQDDGTRSFGRKTWFQMLGWPTETRFRNLFATLGGLVDDIIQATRPGFGVAAVKADITARTAAKTATAVSATNNYPILVGPHQLPRVEGTPDEITVAVDTDTDTNATIYRVSLAAADDTGWVDVPGGQLFAGLPNNVMTITWSSLQERRVGKTVWVRGQFTTNAANATAGLVLATLTYPPTGTTLAQSGRTTGFLDDAGNSNVVLFAYADTLASVGNDANGVPKSGGKLVVANGLNTTVFNNIHRIYFSYAID